MTIKRLWKLTACWAFTNTDGIQTQHLPESQEHEEGREEQLLHVVEIPFKISQTQRITCPHRLTPFCSASKKLLNNISNVCTAWPPVMGWEVSPSCTAHHLCTAPHAQDSQVQRAGHRKWPMSCSSNVQISLLSCTPDGLLSGPQIDNSRETCGAFAGGGGNHRTTLDKETSTVWLSWGLDLARSCQSGNSTVLVYHDPYLTETRLLSVAWGHDLLLFLFQVSLEFPHIK